MKKKTMIMVFCTVLILAISVCAVAGPVPDTGQTKCYDDLGNEITCPQPGKPFYGQDANYTINPLSYTKLDAQGNDLPDSATSWTMMRDNLTGLIWEVKTADGSVHDKDNTYTWYDSNPETNGGDAGTPGDGTDTEDFINALNSANFGGYSGWRMPTREELRSIVGYGKHNPAIDTEYFPNSNTVPCRYWSSATHARSTLNAWYIYYYYGDDNYYDKFEDTLGYNYLRIELTQAIEDM